MKKNQPDAQRSQKLPIKRLSLSRETIRILARGDLDLVVGGKATTGGITEKTATAPSPC